MKPNQAFHITLVLTMVFFLMPRHAFANSTEKYLRKATKAVESLARKDYPEALVQAAPQSSYQMTDYSHVYLRGRGAGINQTVKPWGSEHLNVGLNGAAQVQAQPGGTPRFNHNATLNTAGKYFKNTTSFRKPQ